MKLSELAELERAYERRGYRVVVTTLTGQEIDLQPDEMEGWPTLGEAHVVAERVRRLAKWQGFTAIVVLDPDNEEVERWPPANAVPAPLPPASAAVTEQRVAAPALSGVVRLEGTLTILAQSDERVVLGDAYGTVGVWPRARLAQAEFADRLGGPPNYTTFGSMLIGTTALQFQTLQAGPGLTPTVAFYAGDGDGTPGAWFVHQPVQEQEPAA